ncbi:MAG: hypothetical protein PWQ91_1318 [Eubacteriales bacterium]|nr:hypothetical protein [Eubacteriales bacterium]
MTHTYTFTNQPDSTRYQVAVRTFDKNGNYSDLTYSGSWSSADRTNPTVSISSPANGATTYEYNPENQLVRVVKPNGDVIEFAYDGSGRRISKTVNGSVVKYEYDGDLLAAETDANNNLLFIVLRLRIAES